jgi:hypothetical protein
MRRVNGKLIENPNAKWAISDTTRDDLRAVIRDVFEPEKISLADVERRIEDSGIFDDKRATMIARTEIARAQTEGNLEAWQQSGLVAKVDVVLSAMHDQDDECDDAASGGPYDVDDVPDVPLHPNCECALVIAEVAGEEE